MSTLLIGVVSILLIFLFVALHVPVGGAMALAGLVGYTLLTDFNASVSLFATEAVSAISNVEIGVIPLFLLMGGFAAASGLSADIYRFIYALIGRYRGGLAMATIGASAGFGAVSGSSIATVATMSRIALPEMLSRGYSERLATGSVAAGGTLGIMIPPSIAFIIYGFLTEQFIIALFLAALIPGLLAVLLNLITVLIYSYVSPEASPTSGRFSFGEIARALGRASGAFVLAGIVLGGIYGGVFTVTEAAAVGAALAFLYFLLRGTFTLEKLWDVLLESAANTAMIYLVLIGSSVFSYTMTVSGTPESIVAGIQSLEMSPIMVVYALLAMYIALGCVFESIGAMVLTLPFVFPLITLLGFDPIWWGVVMVIVIEIGMITPPLGLNVFVLRSMSGFELTTIYKGVVPFIGADLVRLLIVVHFPVVAMWLPGVLGF